MNKIVECVPNFSEGRDKEKINAIVSSMTVISGVTLLDQESDTDHNRSVITLVGEPEQVFKAAFEGIKRATDLIDLRVHKGEHPRMGATDVVPFIPISNTTMEECIELAKRLGSKVAQELKIPVYLYEQAATRPERENLADVRKGQFEGIRDEIKTNPARKPDFGPSEVHPSAGAMAIGARMILVAFNVNLAHPDVTYAKEIAKAIRFKDGGFHYTKALGFDIKARNITQVSMNMVNYLGTPLYRAFEFVKTEASRYGINVVGSEIVGLTPLRALTQATEHFLRIPVISDEQITWNASDFKVNISCAIGFYNQEIASAIPRALSEKTGGFKGVIVTINNQIIQIEIQNAKETAIYRVFLALLSELNRFGTTVTKTLINTIPVEIVISTADFYLRIENFKIDQVLEVRLRQKQGNPIQEERKNLLVDKNIKDFLAETASDNPAPGGGSVAALNGALGSALGTMVCNLTIGKEKYLTFDTEFKKIKSQLEQNMNKLTKLVDDDTNAFNDVMSAFKLPKETDDQKAKRTEAIQKGYKKAISVPLETAQTALTTLSLMEYILTNGNQNAITDGAVGALACQTAVKGALLNIKINLTSVKDPEYVQSIKKSVNEIENAMNGFINKINSLVDKNLK